MTRDAEDNPLMATVVNQLLTLMDGIDDTKKICAIASTNRVDMIDEAIKRPGRFDYVIEIQKPTPKGCEEIFKIHTKQMPIDKNFNKENFVKNNLIGCSGAEIAFVVSEAAYNSIRRTININEIFEKKQDCILTEKHIIIEMDFIKAVKKLKENQAKEKSAKYRYNT